MKKWILSILFALLAVAQVSASTFDIRMNADIKGHGTSQLLGLTSNITRKMILDGWISTSPTENGNLHEIGIGIGQPMLFQHFTVVPLVYALRDNDEYAILPSVVIVANTKWVHFFTAPKMVLPFNAAKTPKLVVNPLYVGLKIHKKLMVGASGTVVNVDLPRIGPFVRYGRDGFVELTAFRRQKAPAEFRLRIIFNR